MDWKSVVKTWKVCFDVGAKRLWGNIFTSVESYNTYQLIDIRFQHLLHINLSFWFAPLIGTTILPSFIHIGWQAKWIFLSTSLLGASKSYFFPPSLLLPNPPWNFLIFYINYTKHILKLIQNFYSPSLSLSLFLSRFSTCR